MLERQKLLRETDSQRTPNGILRVYEHRKTGEVFLVRDPDIPLAEIEIVQNEVFLLLENNGRMPEPPAEESPAEDAESEGEAVTEGEAEADQAEEPESSSEEEDEDADDEENEEDDENDEEAKSAET
jgi:hypothetical protein